MKSQLGQFFTTNSRYILQGMYIPFDINIIVEPFTGAGDLLKFIAENTLDAIVEEYDIDPKLSTTIRRNTLADPPNYAGKFVITNPPYLARNKSKDKTLFDKFGVNDLYKCFIKSLISKVDGGIIIVPLNFWSSIRAADIKLRAEFLDKYDIILLNIFEEQVFEDTSYTVCSFQFTIKSNNSLFPAIIYPSGRKMNLLLNESNNFTIGGEIYKLPNCGKYKISRLIKGGTPNTNILVKCIDDNANNKIKLSIDKIYSDDTPNKTARTYATLIINPPIDTETQIKLVNDFNEFLEKQRIKYNSLFLTNYRESKSISRKRISFDLVYDIVKYLLES